MDKPLDGQDRDHGVLNQHRGQRLSFESAVLRLDGKVPLGARRAVTGIAKGSRTGTTIGEMFNNLWRRRHHAGIPIPRQHRRNSQRTSYVR